MSELDPDEIEIDPSEGEKQQSDDTLISGSMDDGKQCQAEALDVNVTVIPRVSPVQKIRVEQSRKGRRKNQ